MAIGDQRDLERTALQLSAWLQTKTPQAAEVSVANLATPGMGFSNETLLADAAWCEGNRQCLRRIVIRFRPARQIFPEYDLQQQYRVLEKLYPTDVPVPRVLWFEADPTVLGGEFFVMDRIDGVVPPDYPTYHAAGVCAEMSDVSRAAIWWDGVEKMARLHRLDWRALGMDFLAMPQWGGSPLEQQLGYYAHFLRWAAGDVPSEVCEAALLWLEAHRPAENVAPAICWGDSRIGNMMFREDRCVAVLDWEMAFLGDPEADLAWWLFLDWHHSAGYGIDRLPGFPTPEETIARWEESTGRMARNLAYYEVFAAFRFAVIMIRVARLAQEAGLPTPEDLATNNPCTKRLREILSC